MFERFKDWIARKSVYAQLWMKHEEGRLDTGAREVSRPYQNALWPHVAINKLARTVAGLRLMVSTESDEIVESGPLVDLLDRPNPETTRTEFFEQTVGHLYLEGRVHWIFVEFDGRRPTEMHVVGGSQMTPVSAKTSQHRLPRLVGWQFDPGDGEGKIPIPLDEGWAIKLFNPYDHLAGMSPARPAKLSIASDYNAAQYNDSSLRNGAEPGGLLVTDQTLTEPQVAQIRAAWQGRHQGVGNAKKAAVLGGGLRWESVVQANNDMQFVELREMSREEILAVWDIPPSVAGIFKDANYAYDLSARQGFMVTTIGPLGEKIADAINRGVAPHFGAAGGIRRLVRVPQRAKAFLSGQIRQGRGEGQLWSWFDLDAHPVVAQMNAEAQGKIFDRARFIPINHLIKAHDLPYPEQPWGDQLLVPATLVPASVLIAEAVAPPEPPAPEGQPLLPASAESGADRTLHALRAIVGGDDDGGDADPLERLVTAVRGTMKAGVGGPAWQSHVRALDGVARRGRARLRGFLLRLEERVVAKVRTLVPTDGGKSAPVVKADLPAIARILFSLREEAGRLLATMDIVYRAGSGMGVDQVLAEIDTPEDEREAKRDQILRDPAITRIAQRRIPILVNILTTIRSRVAAQVAGGLDAGETVTQIAERVHRVMGQTRNRALAIARTETATAVNSARFATMKAAGVTGKAWLTAGDAHVRESHIAAGQEYGPGNPIPVSQAFNVGGSSLMHPNDPSGPPGETVNCRCAMIARSIGKRSIPVPERFLSAGRRGAAEVTEVDVGEE